MDMWEAKETPRMSVSSEDLDAENEYGITQMTPNKEEVCSL